VTPRDFAEIGGSQAIRDKDLSMEEALIRSHDKGLRPGEVSLSRFSRQALQGATGSPRSPVHVPRPKSAMWASEVRRKTDHLRATAFLEQHQHYGDQRHAPVRHRELFSTAKTVVHHQHVHVAPKKRQGWGADMDLLEAALSSLGGQP